jgi:HAD superfamily hydrolase (TIGR01490 family)
METIFSKDRINHINYIAFFDLDLTITKAISGKALARGAYRKGLLTHSDLLKAIILSLDFRFKLKDPAKIIDKLVSWVKGIPENSMVEMCSEVFHEVLLPSVYKEVMTEIEFHKVKNAKVVMLSSALTAICEEMAKNLNMDDIICSELEVKDGYLTGRPVGHICYGEEKSIRLLAYCEKNNSLPSNAWFYSDSISDLPALNAVGNPVCVNPDKKLKKTAIRRGWKVLTWGS